VIDLIDEMTMDWGIPVAPIVGDISQHSGAEQYMSALESRDLEYMIQVNGRYQVRGRLAEHRRRGMLTQRGRKLSGVTHLGDVIYVALRAERHTVGWRDGPDGRLLRSQFITLPIGPVDPNRTSAMGQRRQVLIEWPLSKSQPRAFWLTNLVDWPIDDLVALAKLRSWARRGIDDLAERFGLYRYEGRSFLGWHHHVTIASVAYIFDVCRQLRQNARTPVTGSAWSA
jgi:hypothetical protein